MKIFLENNKIFFDTIATVSFSVMTIILSIVSIYIAMQANKIAAKQVEVAKSEKMPFFTIGLIKELFKDECKYNDYQIINTGGKINNALLVPTFRTQIIIGKSGLKFYENTYNFEYNDLLKNKEYVYDINQNGFNVEIRDDIINKIESKINDKILRKYAIRYKWRINVKVLFDIKYVDFQGNYQCERYILSNNNLIRTKRFQRNEYLKQCVPIIWETEDLKIDYWVNSIFDQIVEELENH